jgi:hypothetical protein
MKLEPMPLIITEDGQLAPKYEDDKPLFMHCTGGLISVTKEYLNDRLKYVLYVHGRNGVIV